MESFESRLKQFLKMEDLSPAKFADSIGIQRSGISHLLAGRNKPSFDFISKMLATYPDLSAEWIMTGKGKPYKNSAQPLPESAQSSSLFAQEQFPEQPSDQDQQFEDEGFIDDFDLAQPAENPIFDPSFEDDTQISAPKSASRERKIVRVTIFYSDGTYEEK